MLAIADEYTLINTVIRKTGLVMGIFHKIPQFLLCVFYN
jgi:hypothetical protein